MDEQPTNRVQRMLQRHSALTLERSSWITHWQDISKFQQPRAGRFTTSDRNRGDKRSNSIIDSAAIFAVRTLRAGMMSGMTSPARPWFRWEVADRDLMEFPAVKNWLHESARLVLAICKSSNTYRTLHTLYGELGLFGTAATVVLPNFDNVVHHYPMTVGEYCIATNDEGHVDTLYRHFEMTVGQMVTQFGEKNCSPAVQSLYRRGRLDQWIPVLHVIEPRQSRDPGKKDSRNMPWTSCYIEPGRDNGQEKYLKESGFKRFRALAPRWDLTSSNDVYGTSPGMETLGDVKQLQQQQLRKSEAIDYQVRPPLQVPSRYREAAKARLPGGVFYVDQVGPNGGVRTAYDVQLNLQHLREDILDVRDRINKAYYVDLFLMLANDTRSGITATEVAERHEEKLLMLGPVLERLTDELLTPLVELIFDEALEAGIMPAPPKELQGQDLKLEFLGVLAQAQKAVAAGGMDQVINRVLTLAQVKPDVVDKLDADQVIDEAGEMFGVSPKIIVPDDTVAKIRQQRAQQQAAAQAAAAAPEMAKAAQAVGDTNVGGVQDVLNMFSGYNSPSAQTVQ